MLLGHNTARVREVGRRAADAAHPHTRMSTGSPHQPDSNVVAVTATHAVFIFAGVATSIAFFGVMMPSMDVCAADVDADQCGTCCGVAKSAVLLRAKSPHEEKPIDGGLCGMYTRRPGVCRTLVQFREPRAATEAEFSAARGAQQQSWSRDPRLPCTLADEGRTCVEGGYPPYQRNYVMAAQGKRSIDRLAELRCVVSSPLRTQAQPRFLLACTRHCVRKRASPRFMSPVSICAWHRRRHLLWRCNTALYWHSHQQFGTKRQPGHPDL